MFPLEVIEGACYHFGAEDFVTTPVSASSLLLRVERVFDRRSAGALVGAGRERQDESYRIDLMERSRIVRINGFSARFSPTDFRFVAYLARRPGKWFFSDVLHDAVLEAHAAQDGSNVRLHAMGARGALKCYHWFIHSAAHRGFMWSVDPCDESHCQAHLAERAVELGLTYPTSGIALGGGGKRH
jgi:DNA-binding response OmpR family regulator